MVMSKPRRDEDWKEGKEGQDWEEYVRERDRAIRKVKRKARSDLNLRKGDWSRGGYAESNILDISNVKDRTPRIPVSSLTREEWLDKYERTRTPVMLTGITKGWKAPTAWSLENLNATYRDTKFKVSEDDNGNIVSISMRHFLDYCQDAHEAGEDDSPLYIFDSNFGHPVISKMLGDYEIPSFFREDLLKYVGEDLRPSYRWVVIGPARSGTWLHLDPLYTSAWNTLVSGTKRWILFPPTIPKNLVSPSLKGEQEAVSWFKYVYPQTQKPSWPYEKPIEIIQRAGETIYVPGGWWHAVLNLDMTVAITQNYANSVNFPMVWTHSVKGRPYMAKKWLAALRKFRPDIAAVADHIQTHGCPECETNIDDDDDADPPDEADYEEDVKAPSKAHAEEEDGNSEEEDEEEEEEPRRRHQRHRPVDEEDEHEEIHASGHRRMKMPHTRDQLPIGSTPRDVQGGATRTLSGLQPGRIHQVDRHAITDGGMPLALVGKEPFLLSHGTLMLSSWVLLFPLAMLLARHKWVLGDRKLRWMHLAFHMVRLVQVLGFLTMVAGLVVALAVLDAPESQVGKLHFFIGAVVFTLTSVRALGTPASKPDSPPRTLRETVHGWLWHLLPVAGFANVVIGIVLMDQITDGHYSYAMWLVPICVVAGCMLVADVVLSNMKMVRGVRDAGGKAAAGYPQDGRVSRAQSVMSSDLHFRAARHGIATGLEVS